MTHQAPPSPALPGADPGRQVAQLRQALLLVRGIAGPAPVVPADEMLDEGARISAAYNSALPIVQRRFDALAAETSAWAAAGVEALLAAGAECPARAAAGRLARELDRAIRNLSGLLD